MKKIYLLLLIAAATLMACEHSEPTDEYIDWSQYAMDAAFTPYRTQVSDVNDEAPWEQYIEDYVLPEQQALNAASASVAPRNATATDVISLVRNVVDMFTYKKVVQVAGTYRSMDVNYKPITLSGKVFYPKDGEVKNVILVSHFTIGANFECPSETFALEGLLATKGYMVVIPDYIGYGITKDRVHPYLQAEVTAYNVIHMLDAVMAWIKMENLPLQSDSIILLGYSQGGATTMHVQRILESEMLYKQKFRIKRTYCGSGPYDVALTYDYSIKKDITGIPCAVPMIIQGMSEGMARPLRMSYFFKEPLLSNYDDWLNSKDYTVKQINLLIGATRLSQILTLDASDKSNPETQRLYKRLIENSINTFYQPSTPMYMFHSMEDQTVPFVNSQHMQLQFDNAGCKNIVYDFGYYGSHTTGMLKFLLKCMKQL